jgi:hypothetical protein
MAARAAATLVENASISSLFVAASNGFGAQVRAPLRGEAIILCFTASVGLLPVSSEEALIFQAMQRRIERPLLHPQYVARDLLDTLRDRVAVNGTERDNF